MELTLSRSLEDLRPVLLDPSAEGPDPVYWVFGEIDQSQKWSNMTVVAPGKLGREFTKTFGHYHSARVDESYAEVWGEGILLLQKKIIREGKFIPNEVSEVLLVKINHGEKVIIPPEYGHSWSNTGSIPLITFDNWVSGHQEKDYLYIKQLRGLAYYLVSEDGQVKPVPNHNYQNLPQPLFLSASEYHLRHN